MVGKDKPKSYEIKEEIIELYYEQLKSNKDKIEYLFKERGITEKTIDKYKIGFDPKAERFTIPIKDSMGCYVNVRKWHRPKNERDSKMISYAEGYGAKRLYPIENLYHKSNKIIFCEGEWDCLLLNQYGFNAVTKTAGVNTWDDEWNQYFNGKDVIFIYDCGNISMPVADKHKNLLMSYASSIKVIDLELGNDGEDITDWFLKFKKDHKELAALIRKSKVRDIYELIDLSQSLESKYYNKKIKFQGIVVGKDLQPYLIPYKVKAKCQTGAMENKKVCGFCPLKNMQPIDKEFRYDTDKDILVTMLNTNDLQIEGILRQALNLPAGRACPGKYTMEILERRNVEEINIIPEINHEVVDQDYVIRTCYFFGSQTKLNQGYLLKGTTWADPKSQSGVHLIEEMKEARDNISKFQLTDEIKEELKIFQPDNQYNIDSIKKKLDDIYTDFTYNVTKMYERKNLLMAIDMVYHSILHFDFLDRPIKKGWLECLLIGDTKCGKSETAESLIRHYRAGEFITSGENTSRAGLLGGEQQTKRGSWNVTWGKLVMNNKGLIILDEADELSKKEIIGQLSGVRSSGVAELVQIQSQKAMAQTRIIWISNPLWGRMSEHNYGVEAIKELFKTQQDISRIDLAVAAAGEDVSDEVINLRHKETYEHKYISKHCHSKVMFAWSRTSDQVKFTKEAEDLILKLATELGKEYTPDIPLVIGAEMRIKLARMAVSLAAILYSTDKTGEQVIVHPAHVQAAYDFIEESYNSKVMGYKDFSQQRKRETEIGDTSRVDDRLLDPEMVSMLLDNNKFQLRDIEDIFNCSKKEAEELIAFMRKNRIMRRIHTFYVKTPAFIHYLKRKKIQIEGGMGKNLKEILDDNIVHGVDDDEDVPF